MKIMSVAALTLLVSVLLSADLGAEVLPGRWEKVDALETGSPIVVALKTGDRNDFQYSSSSETELTVKDPGGGTRILPKSEVEQVTLPPKRDGNTNGALIGLAVGAGGGAAFAAANSEEEYRAFTAPLGAVIFGGIGALAGALVDHSIEHTEVEVLYRAK